MRADLAARLQEQAAERQEAMQRDVSSRLEQGLRDVRRQLDQLIDSVTIEALKRKATQLGDIREIAEDRQSGSLRIVLEL